MPPPEVGAPLRAAFGDIDIYLFDQLLRGRFDGRTRVLDAGCGDGRNLLFLLRHGYTCFGIDRDAAAVARARTLPGADPAHVVVGDLRALPWDEGSMDAVVASAVLHFADDAGHWEAMVRELWRVLAPGGLFFARLASTVGLEARVGAAGQRVRLPDGSVRFVVDEAMLLEWTARLGGQLVDPIKTTNVQQQRCMTTWVVRKAGG